jgi:hypothetical protein
MLIFESDCIMQLATCGVQQIIHAPCMLSEPESGAEQCHRSKRKLYSPKGSCASNCRLGLISALNGPSMSDSIWVAGVRLEISQHVCSAWTLA